MATYRVIGRDTGEPSLNDSLLAGMNVGDTFTATLDPTVEAYLIDAGLIAVVPNTFVPTFQQGFADGNVATWNTATSEFIPGTGSSPSYVTSLPSSPADKLEVYWQVDATNGIAWHMIYVAGSINKWLFLGGQPMYNVVETAETRNANSYADIATIGPSLTGPAAGVYRLAYGAQIANSAQGTSALASPDIAGAGASDNDAVFSIPGTTAGSNQQISTSRKIEKTLAAPLTVVMKYKMSSGTATFSRRWLELLPVRIDPT